MKHEAGEGEEVGASEGSYCTFLGESAPKSTELLDTPYYSMVENMGKKRLEAIIY